MLIYTAIKKVAKPQARTHVRTQAHMYAHMQICTHTCKYVHTHANMYTHTPSCKPSNMLFKHQYRKTSQLLLALPHPNAGSKCYITVFCRYTV